jgi:hypothetical protein
MQIVNTHFIRCAQLMRTRCSARAPLQVAGCRPAFLSMLRYLYLSHSET